MLDRFQGLAEVYSVNVFAGRTCADCQELYSKIRELCVQDPGETHRGIDFPCFLQLMSLSLHLNPWGTC